MVPYAEPSYFTKKFHSPYFNESHLNFKLELRKFFVEKVNLLNKDITFLRPMGRKWLRTRFEYI